MLQLVIFPRRNDYFPKRLNLLIPNEPSYLVIGIPANEVYKAMLENIVPITSYKQLEAKKTFVTELRQ